MEKYTAGFFDGEGCVAVYEGNSRFNTPLFYLRVDISQNHRGVLETIQTYYGGSINRMSNQRAWSIQWTSKSATPFLTAIRDHLIVKRDQVDLALEFQKLIQVKGKKRRLTEDEVDDRRWFKEELQRLKRI
jgi:hypothetical protein